MKILIKIPSLGRAEKLLAALKKYIELRTLPDTMLLVSLNFDDLPMIDSPAFKELFLICKDEKNIKFWFDERASTKVGAINRDMLPGYDIVVAAADDMIPEEKGFDALIAEHMQLHFPDRDGVLFFNDGYRGSRLNTLSIMGMPYYERFGYIYNPAYSGFYCDNEFMEVAYLLHRQVYIDRVVIRHEHPDNNPEVEDDATYKIAIGSYQDDKRVYDERKKIKFGL